MTDTARVMGSIDTTAPTRQRVAAAGLLGAVALLWFLPFVWTEHRFPLQALDAELVAACCVALGLLSCGLAARADLQIGWRLPAFLVVLSAIGLIQLMLGELAYPLQAGRLALYLAPVLFAYLLGRQLVAMALLDDAIDALTLAAMLGGLYSVSIQWMQLLQLDWLPHRIALLALGDPYLRDRPFANIAQANQLATYLGVAALSTFYWQARSSRALAWSAGVLLLLSTGFAISGSRMGALFAILLLALLFIPTGLRPRTRKTAFIFAGALALGYLAGLIASRSIGGGCDTVTRFEQGTLPIRFELWREALAISFQHPLLGVGVGQFAMGELWIGRSPFANPANNSHNLLLQLAAEYGWPVALAGVALTFWWLRTEIKARLAIPGVALAISALVLIGIHSMLEFPLWHLYFAAPAALMFAFSEPGAGFIATGDSRRVFALAGFAMLGVVFALRIEFDPIVDAGAPLLLESRHLRNRVAEDSLSILVIADSRLYRPEADRFLLELKHPPDEMSGGALLRTDRLLHLLPAPEVMSQRIILLAKAGRIDEALALAGRLPVFGAAFLDTYRDWILDQTRDLGPQAAPLRRALRELHSAPGQEKAAWRC